MASFVFNRFLRFDDLTTLLHEVTAEYGNVGRLICGPAFAPWTSDRTAERAKAEWVVTGSAVTAIVVEIAHQRAGRRGSS